jgi:hypothetical protein
MPKNSINSLDDNHPFKKHDKVYNDMDPDGVCLEQQENHQS